VRGPARRRHLNPLRPIPSLLTAVCAAPRPHLQILRQPASVPQTPRDPVVCQSPPLTEIVPFFSRGETDERRETCTSIPQPLNPQPSSLNPQPLTLNPHPSTRNPQPSTLNPQPSALNLQSSTLGRESLFISQPSTLNPHPSTLILQPSTLNPQTWWLADRPTL
jgi:hypothetical protein